MGHSANLTLHGLNNSATAEGAPLVTRGEGGETT